MANTLIVAHRGDARHAPENTLSAFESAIRAGAGAIEFDVQEAADGEVFVFHDLYLGRTIKGQSRFGSLTTDQIKRLDAGREFSDEFLGERVPSLHEVLSLFRGRVRFEIELKTPSWSLSEKVIRALREFNLLDSVEVTSGHAPLLCKVHEWHRDIEIGTWFNPPPDWIKASDYLDQIDAYADLIGLRVVHLHETLLSSESVEKIRKSGRLIHGANLDTEMSIRNAIDLGINRFSTNSLSLAASAVS